MVDLLNCHDRKEVEKLAVYGDWWHDWRYTSIKVFSLTDTTIPLRPVKRTQHMVLLWNFLIQTQHKPLSLTHMLIANFQLWIKEGRGIAEVTGRLWYSLSVYVLNV